MPVRFVLGRAGTGKTWHCLNAASAWARERGVGVPVFLLVPSQATFSTERELACREGAAARLNVRVVSFESLARELGAAETGKELFVSARGRRLVLAQILRDNAPRLQYFGESALQPHLASRLEAAIAEIQQELLSIEQIEAVLLAGETARNTETAAKLHDLHLITTEYTKFLGQERTDPLRRLQQLETFILKSPLVQGSLVLVDGFAGFTAVQVKILTALARRCERLDLCLLHDGDTATVRPADDLGIFARTRRTYARLLNAFRKEGVPIAQPLLLHYVHRHTNDALKAIEAQWETDRPKQVAANRTEVAIVEASDLDQEVAYAARRIRLWQLQSVRLREIGILCRNLEPYHAAIARTFAEHGIACFIDRRRPLASHPLVRYVNTVLQITRQGWRQSYVLELLKTGLSGLSIDEADFLENFALEHGIDKTAWSTDAPWQFTQSYAAEDEVPEDERADNARAERLRQKLVAPIRKLIDALKTPRPMREHVRELYDLLCCQEHNLRATLGAWSRREQEAGNPEAAQEHQQAWKQVMELLDDAVRLLGDVEIAGEQFVQTVSAGLEDLDLALTPPTLDQVMVGQIDRSRSPEFKKVIVMGLNEGEFPTLFTEDPIFSDAERDLLQQHDIEFAPGSAQQILAENMLGYIAMTRAAETLVLTRPLTTGEGRETAPSSFIRRVQGIVTGKILQPAGQATAGSVEAISSPLQAAIAIVEYLNNKAAGLKIEPDVARQFEELARWLLEQGDSSPMTAPTLFAQRGMAYENKAALDGEQVEKLYANPLVSSVSRLESFASCPFKHFAQYGLKLRDREVAEISSLDLGNAFHFVLERMARQIIETRGTWDEIAEADIDEMADTVAKELRNQLLLTGGRNRYVLAHIKSTLRRVLRDQKIAQNAGDFRPLGAEITFGERDDATLGPLEITTPSGKQLKLQGKIDRVDWVEHELRVAVYDYKLRGKQLRLKEVLNGLTLQLLVYLLVLEQQGGALCGGKKLTPAGAFYLRLLRTMESAKMPSDPLPPDEMESLPEGLFERDAFELFDGVTQSGEASKVLKAKRNKGGDLAKSGSALSQEAIDNLLDRVRQKVAELGDQLLAGDVEVRPYRLNKSTPCEHCDFRPVCRIDPLLNRYLIIAKTREADLRKELAGDEAEDEA